jgi:hypothetical protein
MHRDEWQDAVANERIPQNRIAWGIYEAGSGVFLYPVDVPCRFLINRVDELQSHEPHSPVLLIEVVMSHERAKTLRADESASYDGPLFHPGSIPFDDSAKVRVLATFEPREP